MAGWLQRLQFGICGTSGKNMTFDLQIMPHYTVKLVLATTMVTTWEKRTRHVGLETISTGKPGRARLIL